jgi:hypothetical protein
MNVSPVALLSPAFAVGRLVPRAMLGLLFAGTCLVACGQTDEGPGVNPDPSSSNTTTTAVFTTDTSPSSSPTVTPTTPSNTPPPVAPSTTSNPTSAPNPTTTGANTTTAPSTTSGPTTLDSAPSSAESSDVVSSEADVTTTEESETSDAGYQPCPATGPCVIMPYGDSITEGFPIWGGYRIELFRMALAAGKDITFVGSAENGPNQVDGVAFPKKHEGHGGWTIQDSGNNQGIFKLAGPSITQYKPHIITLMIGTNDINGNIDVNNAPNRLNQLLDEIYKNAPDVLVILAQIVPSQTDGLNARISTYNAAFPDIVAGQVAKGRNLILIDMYSAFTRDANYKNSLLGDNLHPNQAGYARMAEVWFETLSPFLR